MNQGNGDNQANCRYDEGMNSTELQPVADTILRLAKQHGSVTSRDVRSELRIAGLPETAWKETLALVEGSLVHRQGRYYLKTAFNPRMQKQHVQQRAVEKVIRRLIKKHKSRSKQDDRRGQVRVDFIQPVKFTTEDGTVFGLLSRDLSAPGVRLAGPKRLLG